jgi:hypothetical protein
MKITEKIFDAVTGEETIIERDETAEEIAHREAKLAEAEAKLAEAEAKAQARAELLKRIGISEEEVQLLLS